MVNSQTSLTGAIWVVKLQVTPGELRVTGGVKPVSSHVYSLFRKGHVMTDDSKLLKEVSRLTSRAAMKMKVRLVGLTPGLWTSTASRCCRGVLSSSPIQGDNYERCGHHDAHACLLLLSYANPICSSICLTCCLGVRIQVGVELEWSCERAKRKSNRTSVE